jgi:prepilin-type N-terminal cleavage/methylation domain-containing protein
MTRTAQRAGFTLLELLLALSLMSILIVALVRLLDTSMNIWGRADAGRDLMESGTAVLDLMADDIDGVEGGPRGDLLAEWALLDTDRDGISGMPWMRLRLVRSASAAEVARLAPDRERRAGRELIEVCWALLPPSDGASRDERSSGVLWRGERMFGDTGSLGFFDERFFSESGKPPAGALYAVTGGVLWWNMTFATSTSTVHDGWNVGGRLADATLAWDAWTRDRASTEVHLFNERGAGIPDALDRPVLPRRVLIEIELERPAELRRRPRLAAPIDGEDQQLVIDDDLRAPEEGTFVLVDEEWIKVTSVSGRRLSVRRGERGTRARPHEQDAVLHYGWRVVREVDVPLHREDWVRSGTR